MKKVESKSPEDNKLLGSGACGCVFQWNNVAEGRMEAVKEICLGSSFSMATSEKLRNEEAARRQDKYDFAMMEYCILEVITKKRIPYCIQLYSSYIMRHPSDGDNMTFTFHLKFAEGGDLFAYINKNGCLKEATSRRLIRQLLIAIKKLFDAHILHNDLKPENILLVPRVFRTDGRRTDVQTPEDDFPFDILLTDFNLGCFTDSKNEKLVTACGSMHYMAPELFCGELTGNPNENFRAALYSLGIILFVMLTGSLPYDDLTNYPETTGTESQTTQEKLKLYNLIRCVKWLFWTPNHLNNTIYYVAKQFGLAKDATNLIRRLLVRNPKDRITFREIFKHPWMTKSMTKSRIQKKKIEYPSSSSRRSIPLSISEHFRHLSLLPVPVLSRLVASFPDLRKL